MASAVTIPASPHLPTEILQQICGDLGRSDLKCFRLVCKDFGYAAESFLFRKVYLDRDVESFGKLYQIACHPRMSQHVRCLQFTDAIVRSRQNYLMLEDWSRTLNKSHPTPAEEDARYYAQYRGCTMDDYPKITRILAKLPRLIEVSRVSDRHDFFSYTWHFTSLLRAAHAVHTPLSTIKAFRLPWSEFKQSEDITTLMVSIMEACQHLALGFVNDRQFGRVTLAAMISGAPCLHTLEISFHVRQSQDKNRMVEFRDVFKRDVQWPNLKYLKIHSVKGRDYHLKSLLTDHATTLRVLEIADFDLELYQRGGKKCHGSWVDIILFLQSSLHLQSVRLEGSLSNRLDEAWWSMDIDEEDDYDISLQGPCLKHRIQRFVVEGGTFPLPMHDAVVRAGGWEHVEYDADPSWNFDFELLHVAEQYPNSNDDW